MAQKELLDPWTEQLISSGVRVMYQRAGALARLGELACYFHQQLAGAAEELSLIYAPSVALPQQRTATAWAEAFREKLAELFCLKGNFEALR